MTGLRSERTVIVLFGVVIVVLVAATSAVGWLWSFLACSGDGGYPYAARDSPAGRVCRVYDAHEGLWAVQLVLPFLVTLALLTAAVVRTRIWLGTAALVTGLALSLVPAVVLGSLSDSCSPSDQRAFREWADGGGRGPMPADCETY